MAERGKGEIISQAAKRLRDMGGRHASFDDLRRADPKAIVHREVGKPVRIFAVGEGPAPADHDDMPAAGAGQLKAIIERIERLEEEKRNIAADIKDIYAEAKGSGFDGKIIRKIVALRRQEPAERHAQEELLAVYLRALGME